MVANGKTSDRDLYLYIHAGSLLPIRQKMEGRNNVIPGLMRT